MGKLKKKPIYQGAELIGFEAPQKDLKIEVCEKSKADQIIIKNHYSHKATKNSFLSFLVYYKGNIEGAIQIGYGINPKNKGIYKADEVREFDRMYLTDIPPKFSETICISLLHHYLQKKYPEIKYLISYSDNSDDVGNEGIIYKASNYRLIAKTKSRFFLLESGERVHPITMWHRHKTQKWDFLKKQYPNIKRSSGYQLKFIYQLQK